MSMGVEEDHITDDTYETGQYGSISSEDGSGELSSKKKGCCRLLPDVYVTEIRVLLGLAWPVEVCFQSATTASLSIPSIIAVMFCGHFGTTQLNSVGLSRSFVFITGSVVAFSIAGACDTYFSQYHGSANRHKLGTILQKSVLMSLLLAMPSIALQLNGALLLRMVGQSAEESRLAGRYMVIAIPGTLAMFVVYPLIRFLQCQNVVIPTLLITTAAICLETLLHYLFINVADLGTDGSAIAYSISCFSLMFGLIMYIRFSGILQGIWEGWSMACLEEWGGFFKLAILGLIIIGVDLMCFEVGLLLSGLLGETQLSAQVVLFQLNAFISYAIFGIGIASGVRVGNLLGAGEKHSAQRAAKVSIIVSAVVGATLAALLIGMRFQLPSIFSSEKNTLDLVSHVMPATAMRLLCSAIDYTVEGILRGNGRQAVDTIIVLTGHSVALALGLSLMFKTPLLILGLWIGYVTGMTLEAIIGNIVLITTDWEYQVQRALKLTNSIPDENPEIAESPEPPMELEKVAAFKRTDDGFLTPARTFDTTLYETPFRRAPKATILKRLGALLSVLVVFLVGLTTRLTLQVDIDTEHQNRSEPTTASTIGSPVL